MFHYLYMSQTDFLRNNVIEELLRERTNYYLSQKKKRDFWILLSPQNLLDVHEQNFLKATSYSQKEVIRTKGKESFFTVFISTNEELIDWIVLRLGEFEKISSENSFDYSSSVLNREFIDFNGIRGKKAFFPTFFSNNIKCLEQSHSVLLSCSSNVEPTFLVRRFEFAKKVLKSF